MQLNRHDKKLEVGDEVYVVRRGRHRGLPDAFNKHKVEKVYKNSNVIVNGDQYRCRSTFSGFDYEKTGGRDSWSITPELWPISTEVEKHIADQRAEFKRRERIHNVREGMGRLRYDHITDTELAELERILDAIKRRMDDTTGIQA